MVPDYYARLGVDPGADPAEIEAALKQQEPVWPMGTRNPKTRRSWRQVIEDYAFPVLGGKLIDDIGKADVLGVLRQ
ncbi:MAG: phage integrase central domain-containing protein, partial [Isosphaeraceae bacterium]